jgi:hypothetical protein
MMEMMKYPDLGWFSFDQWNWDWDWKKKRDSRQTYAKIVFFSALPKFLTKIMSLPAIL